MGIQAGENGGARTVAGAVEGCKAVFWTDFADKANRISRQIKCGTHERIREAKILVEASTQKRTFIY